MQIGATSTALSPTSCRTRRATPLNSLAFQKKLFGFDPSKDIHVLLLDFQDSGNAGADVGARAT